MNRITRGIMSFVAILTLMVAPAVISSPGVFAATPKEEICKGSGGTWSAGSCVYKDAGNTDFGSVFRNIINILLFVIGAISVLMIVIGGIRYTTSGGDQAGVKGAKDTILYAIIGLVVALMAFALVNFVLTSFK